MTEPDYWTLDMLAGPRFVCECPGRLRSMKFEGDVLVLWTDAGDFVLTGDRRLLPLGKAGRC